MFYEQLEMLCQQRNLTVTGVTKHLGMSSGTVANWKNGKLPNGDTLLKFADFFDVSTDYLLMGKKNIDELSESEKNWLYLYSQLSDYNKIECVGFIKGYIAAQNKLSSDYNTKSN